MADLGTSRPNDARAVRSRGALRRVLLELIEHKPLDEISIREITARAGVSYPTFFRNYASKEDLVSDLATEELRQLLSVMVAQLDKKDTHVSADAICHYVQEHRLLWKTLLTTGASSVMRDEFVRIAKLIVRERGQINPGYPVDMVAPVVVSGMFEILAWWLRQPEDYPLGNVSQFLELLVLKPTLTRQKIVLS